MIKDVVVRLDGSAADEVRLAAAGSLAGHFESHIVAMLLNVLPFSAMGGWGAYETTVLKEARAQGDRAYEELLARLEKAGRPVELHRFDVFPDDLPSVAAGVTRTADVFVALRPDGNKADPDALIEAVLFGSGRHLFLVPGDWRPGKVFLSHILVAWDGSREAARALAEGMPYLHEARTVTLMVVDDSPEQDPDPMLGAQPVAHLARHGIGADLARVRSRHGDIGATLIAEAGDRLADLIIMGGYGHSRLREWLLGRT